MGSGRCRWTERRPGRTHSRSWHARREAARTAHEPNPVAARAVGWRSEVNGDDRPHGPAREGNYLSLVSQVHPDGYADATHSDQGECEPQPVTPGQARLKLPASRFQLRSFVLEVSLRL